MKPKEREELAESFSGVDRILYDRLTKKVGTLQRPTGNVINDNIFGFVPIFGGVLNLTETNKADNLRIELEKSFQVNEVKEIIAESQKEHNKVIEGAKNYIIRMEG